MTPTKRQTETYNAIRRGGRLAVTFFTASPGSLPCCLCRQDVSPGDADYTRGVLGGDVIVCLPCLRAAQTETLRAVRRGPSSLQRLQDRVDADPSLLASDKKAQGEELHRAALALQQERLNQAMARAARQ